MTLFPRPPTVMLTIISSLLACTAWADIVDDYVRAQLAAQHIPGLSLAVMRDGAVIKSAGYGLADLEQRKPAGAGSVYPLCSVTKQFVAAAILLLERDGRLRLEDPVTKHLDFVGPGWRDITLRHLLTMTSGIKDYVNDPLAPGGRSLNESRDFPKTETTADEILRRVAALPLNFSPGEKFAYSNTNYIALARIITRVSGSPWHEFLNERIFEPLGMKQTGFDDARAILHDRAGRYDVVGHTYSHEWRNTDWVNPTFWWQGGAGIVSTVSDMAKWDAALRGGRILAEVDLRRMRARPSLADGALSNYGFGWNTDDYEGHSRMWHNGSIPGGSIHFTRFDDGKLSVIAMANTPANLDAIAIDVAGLLEPALAHPSFLLSIPFVSGTVGSPLRIEARAANWGRPTDALVAIEIRSSPYGRDDVAAKQTSTSRRFEQGHAVSSTFTWTPPTAGEYRVYVGVFSEDWSRLYAWQNAAGAITVK
jgi:CubicO group peptidase (beta-lactamase class C family)